MKTLGEPKIRQCPNLNRIKLNPMKTENELREEYGRILLRKRSVQVLMLHFLGQAAMQFRQSFLFLRLAIRGCAVSLLALHAKLSLARVRLRLVSGGKRGCSGS